VLTCVSGGRFVQVMDFPVYNLFRASTPLPVHNLCENVEWEGMYMRLRMYKDYLQKHQEAHSNDRRQRLFVVSDGMDVIFNDLSQLMPQSADHQQRMIDAVALLIINRYEALVGDSTTKAVFSSERLCGWGGAHMCNDADDSRYPNAPTDSKYLNAGGYIGPAAVLLQILDVVLAMAAKARSDADMGDLRAKTTARDAAGGETDQYFFKLYFWEHPETVMLDYHQDIFGNFLEVEHSTCYDGWKPRCAFEPCCTISDSFSRFREVFYERYSVEGCQISRLGRTPISWHGNGAGKWIWLLALDTLARSCPYVANLTVEKYPVGPIEDMWREFDKSRVMAT